MAHEKLEYLRLLITDVEQNDTGNYIFTDDQLETYLNNTGNVYFAAAFALRTIAANEVLLSKYIRTDDLTVDGPSVSKELRLLALDYENQGKSEVAQTGDNYGAALVMPTARFQALHVPEGNEYPCLRW